LTPIEKQPETFNKMEDELHHPEDIDEMNEEQLKEVSKLLAGSKASQAIFVVSYVSIFIGTIENPLELGLTA